MEDEKKNKHIIWQDFLNYLMRSFTPEEMHDFERKVDKSVFDYEAMEGLETFAGASMNYDIENLKDKIRGRNIRFGAKRESKSFPVKNIAAAAVIVLLLGTGAGFWIFGDKGNGAPVTEQMEAVQDKKLFASVSPDSIDTVKAKQKPQMAMMTASEEKKQKEETVTIDEDLELEMADEDITVEVATNQVMPVAVMSQKMAPMPELETHGYVKPERDNEDLRQKIVKAFEENNQSYTGNITFELVFSKKATIESVSVIKGGDASLNQKLTELVKKQKKWLLENDEHVKEGTYYYSIDL